MPTPVQARYEDIITAVLSALGEEAFAAAKGRAMTLDEAIAFALEEQGEDLDGGTKSY